MEVIMTISNKKVLFFMAAMLSFGFNVYGMEKQTARPSSAPTVQGAKEQKLVQSDSKLSTKSRVAIHRDLITAPEGKVVEVLISVDTGTRLDYHVRASEQQKSSSYRMLLEKIIAEFSERLKRQSEADLQKNFVQDLANLQTQIDILKMPYEQIIVFIKINIKINKTKSCRLVYTLKPRKNDEKMSIPFKPKTVEALIDSKDPKDVIMVCSSFDTVLPPLQVSEVFIFIDTEQQELLNEKRAMLEVFTARLLETLKTQPKPSAEDMQDSFVKALETFQKQVDALKISYKQIKFLMKVKNEKSRWEYTLKPRKIECRNFKPFAIGALTGISAVLLLQQAWASSQQQQPIGYWDYYWDYVLRFLGFN